MLIKKFFLKFLQRLFLVLFCVWWLDSGCHKDQADFATLVIGDSSMSVTTWKAVCVQADTDSLPTLYLFVFAGRDTLCVQSALIENQQHEFVRNDNATLSYLQLPIGMFGEYSANDSANTVELTIDKYHKAHGRVRLRMGRMTDSTAQQGNAPGDFQSVDASFQISCEYRKTLAR